MAQRAGQWFTSAVEIGQERDTDCLSSAEFSRQFLEKKRVQLPTRPCNFF